jgi:hypothetical protein
MIWKEHHEKLPDGNSIASALQAEFDNHGDELDKLIAHASGSPSSHLSISLLPPGLARTLGYWFDVRQVMSQTISLAVIETCLAALIAFDIRRQLNARPFIVAFLAYNATAVVWIALGRPV